jgi:hypothetical protein
MRKVFFNKLFLLTILLTVSLSAFSFIAYKKSIRVCSAAECVKKNMNPPIQKGDLPWEAVSRQFTSFVSIH